jgi:hypothetical protein
LKARFLRRKKSSKDEDDFDFGCAGEQHLDDVEVESGPSMVNQSRCPDGRTQD